MASKIRITINHHQYAVVEVVEASKSSGSDCNHKINSNSSGSGNSTVRDSNGTMEKIKHSNQPASTSSGGVGGTIYNCSTASSDNNPFLTVAVPSATVWHSKQ